MIPAGYPDRVAVAHDERLRISRALDVRATAESELLVATSRFGDVEAHGEAMLIDPTLVTVQVRGRDAWEREVHDVAVDQVPARHLMVGETFNIAGGWSSFPPHKHDGTDGEPVLEEVYYYRFDRPGGFGLQGLYDTDGDARAVFLRHGSIVGIPRGYHPVCAAPGYRLYYLWVLAGAHRQLAVHEDPAHHWLDER